MSKPPVYHQPNLYPLRCNPPSLGKTMRYSALHCGQATRAVLLPRCFSSTQRCRQAWCTHLVEPRQRHGRTHSAVRSSSSVAKHTQQLLKQTRTPTGRIKKWNKHTLMNVNRPQGLKWTTLLIPTDKFTHKYHFEVFFQWRSNQFILPLKRGVLLARSYDTLIWIEYIAIYHDMIKKANFHSFLFLND